MALRLAVPLVCSCVAMASLYLDQSIASTFAADATAPETTIDLGPSGPTRSSTLTFAFSSSETGSSFECSLDGAAIIPCSSPTTLGPLADGAHSFAVRATGPFEKGYISPTVTDSHQGYATDGTYHYLFGTNSIYKDDATWSSVVENSNPNSGLVSTHLGDGDYYNGSLYVPSEPYDSCKPSDVNSARSILVFDASDLSRVGVHDISAQEQEISGVAVAPDIGANGTIFASDYCDPSHIYEYDLSSFEFLGDVHLSHGIFAAQGLAYRNGRLYVSSDAKAGKLYAVDPLTGATALVYTSDNVGVANWEGIDYSQDTLRWTLNYGDGVQQVQYLNAGATDTSPAVSSFTVDTIAPQTTIASGPSGPTNNSAPTFAFSSNEAGSVFQCRLDSGNFTPCSSPYATAVLPDGAHIFYVRAIDQAGNTDMSAAVRRFRVDTVAPQTTIASGPRRLTKNSTPTFAFSSNEAGSSFECRLDNGKFTACSSPFTTAVLPDGAHTFYVRAIDQAGNTDMSAATRFFRVETKTGKIFAHLNKKSFAGSQAGKVRLVYRFSPRSKSFHYLLVRIDGASWRTVRNVTRSGDFKGSYSMTIKALFASKWIESGRYRLIVSADRNRALLAFEIL